VLQCNTYIQNKGITQKTMLSVTETLQTTNNTFFNKVLTNLKILSIRFISVSESIGAAKAAHQLFSLNYRDEAQDVMMNYRRAAEARDRLIKILKSKN